MSIYKELKQNPPALKVKSDVKEVIFTMISCMCDNKSFIRFKRNEQGEFKMSAFNKHVSLAFANYQIEYHAHDLEWVADEDDWSQIIEALNSGTDKIQSVKSR